MPKSKSGRSLCRNSRGQGILEYLILVALIGLVSVTAVKFVGQKLRTKLMDTNRAIEEGIPIPDFSR